MIVNVAFFCWMWTDVWTKMDYFIKNGKRFTVSHILQFKIDNLLLEIELAVHILKQKFLCITDKIKVFFVPYFDVPCRYGT